MQTSTAHETFGRAAQLLAGRKEEELLNLNFFSVALFLELCIKCFSWATEVIICWKLGYHQL